MTSKPKINLFIYLFHSFMYLNGAQYFSKTMPRKPAIAQGRPTTIRRLLLRPYHTGGPEKKPALARFGLIATPLMKDSRINAWRERLLKTLRVPVDDGFLNHAVTLSLSYMFPFSSPKFPPPTIKPEDKEEILELTRNKASCI